MSIDSSFFERLLSYSQSQGIKNLSALSDALGYEKPEKLYRLKRDKTARPSFEVLADITNLFEDLDLRWLITGISKGYAIPKPSEPNVFREPQAEYMSRSTDGQQLLKEKERLIDQQKETIAALNEAYGQLKLRLEENKK